MVDAARRIRAQRLQVPNGAVATGIKDQVERLHLPALSRGAKPRPHRGCKATDAASLPSPRERSQTSPRERLPRCGEQPHAMTMGSVVPHSTFRKPAPPLEWQWHPLPAHWSSPETSFPTLNAVGFGAFRFAVAFGGVASSGKPSDAIHAIDVRDAKNGESDSGGGSPWQRIIPKGVAPAGRFAHAACSWGNHRLVIHGGVSAQGELRNDVHILAVLRPSSALSRQVSGAKSVVWQWCEVGVGGECPPPRRSHAIAAADEQTIFLYGGEDGVRQGDSGLPTAVSSQMFVLIDLEAELGKPLQRGTQQQAETTPVPRLTWTEVDSTGKRPPALYSHELLALGRSRLVLVGGCGTATQVAGGRSESLSYPAHPRSAPPPCRTIPHTTNHTPLDDVQHNTTQHS